MEPFTTVEKEIRWLEGLWESGLRARSLLFKRVAKRLVELENTLDIQNEIIEKSHKEIKLAKARIKKWVDEEVRKGWKKG